MADLVGRTINASPSSNGLYNLPPRTHRNANSRSTTSYTTRVGNASTIATSDIGHDVSRLYALVETAMMNMPVPDSAANTNELRPTELARTREMLNQTWEAIREWLAAHPSPMDRQQAAMHRDNF